MAVTRTCCFLLGEMVSHRNNSDFSPERITLAVVGGKTVGREGGREVRLRLKSRMRMKMKMT